MSNATHRDKVIAAVTVPGTPVTITITRRAVRRSEVSKCLTATYVVERQTNGCTFVNYLSCGRDNLTEARKEANFLWSDTVARRNVDSLKVLAVTNPSEALYRAEAELPHDHFMRFVAWMTDDE